jgi:hypothetical protein
MQVRFPCQFNIALNLKNKREKLADRRLEERYKDQAYGVQFLRMGLENLKILQEKRDRENAEGGDLQSVPLVRVPKQVKKETSAYVKKTIPSKTLLTSASPGIAKVTLPRRR